MKLKKKFIVFLFIKRIFIFGLFFLIILLMYCLIVKMIFILIVIDRYNLIKFYIGLKLDKSENVIYLDKNKRYFFSLY